MSEHLLLVASFGGVRNVLQTWGAGERGETGQGYLGDAWTARTVRQLLGTAPLDVAFGYHHALCLSYTQDVYSWGEGNWGALGRVFPKNVNTRARDVLLPTPTIIPDLQGYTIVEIAAGGWHSAARLGNGNVLTWGWNSHGQLGHGGFETEWVPRIVHELVSRSPQMIARRSPAGCVIGLSLWKMGKT